MSVVSVATAASAASAAAADPAGAGTALVVHDLKNELGALVSISLFWTATPHSLSRIRTGALLGALHIGGFFVAAAFKNAAGAAFDADGRVLFGFLPPAMLHLGTSAALLFAGVRLCHRKGKTT